MHTRHHVGPNSKGQANFEDPEVPKGVGSCSPVNTLASRAVEWTRRTRHHKGITSQPSVSCKAKATFASDQVHKNANKSMRFPCHPLPISSTKQGGLGSKVRYIFKGRTKGFCTMQTFFPRSTEQHLETIQCQEAAFPLGLALSALTLGWYHAMDWFWCRNPTLCSPLGRKFQQFCHLRQKGLSNESLRKNPYLPHLTWNHAGYQHGLLLGTTFYQEQKTKDQRTMTKGTLGNLCL